MARLVIDASNAHLSIALFKDNNLINEFNVDCKKNLSEILLLEINNILINSKIDKKSLSEIIVTKGPGSYTALRIVLSVAKTLAMVLNIEIKVISSLRLQAVLKNSDNKLIVPLIDGRRGNVYSAIYEDDKEILKEGYYSLEEIFDKLHKFSRKVIFIGNDVNNFNFSNLNFEYELVKIPILAKNVVFVENFLESVDFYNAKPSYLRLTEAERNLRNDKN